MDLAGSNAWYRKFIDTGWVGTPEECKAKFGMIPKGATLFIHEFDGGEEKRGYYDGLGNASHIGIKTGTGKGAIHSSSTRGCVAESEFHDKTISGGGWNTVGLSTLFSYGEEIDRIIAGGGEMMEQKKAVVDVPNGTTVNMRSKDSTSSALVERIPNGEEVSVIKKEDEWSKCSWKKKTGWIMNEYLIFEEDKIQNEDDFDYPEQYVTIKLNARDADCFISFLEQIEKQIVNQIGRG